MFHFVVRVLLFLTTISFAIKISMFAFEFPWMIFALMFIFAFSLKRTFYLKESKKLLDHYIPDSGKYKREIIIFASMVSFSLLGFSGMLVYLGSDWIDVLLILLSSIFGVGIWLNMLSIIALIAFPHLVNESEKRKRLETYDLQSELEQGPALYVLEGDEIVDVIRN